MNVVAQEATVQCHHPEWKNVITASLIDEHLIHTIHPPYHSSSLRVTRAR